MANLSEDIKILLIERLATFVPGSEIVKELKQDHDLTLTLQQVGAYDPATVAGQRLSPKLKTLFFQVRKRFIDDESSIAIAHRAFRLRRLMQIADSAKSQKLQMQALEQAAKEAGGAYTNRLMIFKGLGTMNDSELDAFIAAGVAKAAVGSPGRDSNPAAAPPGRGRETKGGRG